MYICRKCNTAVDDSDRFCSGCGAYIGEPAVKKNDWETANNDEGIQEDDKNIEDISESISEAESNISELVAYDDSAFSRTMESIGSKKIFILTFAIFISIPLFLSLITKFTISIPNDLIHIIFPVNLISADFKHILNLPASFTIGFLFSFLGLSVISVVSFATIYIYARLILKMEIDLIKLWKALMQTFMVYSFTLALFLVSGFVSKTFASVLMFLGHIVTLLTYYGGVQDMTLSIKNKSIPLVTVSVVMVYSTVYAYVYLFLR